MQVEKVVINASPFILLCKSGLAGLLPQLFKEIRMPEAVRGEIERGGDTASYQLHDYEQTWLKRCLIDSAPEVLVWNLGDGETEVLSFALVNEHCTALVDDRAARKCADTLSVKTLGTGGILILAKKRGLIQDVSHELLKLTGAGLWLSDEIVEVILKQAGEL
ncbi:MAG: DUF3368 domain-containing protein [Acidobacteriota bacterium]|nr:DUF3368 domain-containing protein [Acidobacteriota bacterium]